MNRNPHTYEGPGLSPLSRQIAPTPSITPQLSSRHFDPELSVHGRTPSMLRRKKSSDMVRSMAGSSGGERAHPLRRSTRVVSRMKSFGNMGSLGRMGSFMRRHGDQGRESRAESRAESNVEGMTGQAEDVLPDGVNDVVPAEEFVAGPEFSVGNRFGNERGNGRSLRRSFRHSAAPVQSGREVSYQGRPTRTIRRWRSKLLNIPNKLESTIKGPSSQIRHQTPESGESSKEYAVMVRFQLLGEASTSTPISASPRNATIFLQSESRAALILLNQHTSFSDLMSKIHEVITRDLFDVSIFRSEYSTCSVCACFHEEVHVWKRRLCVKDDLELSRVLRYMEMEGWKRSNWLEVEWVVGEQVEMRDRPMTGETVRPGSSIYSRTTGGGAVSREEMMMGGGDMRAVVASEIIEGDIVQGYRDHLPHSDRWGKNRLEGEERGWVL